MKTYVHKFCQFCLADLHLCLFYRNAVLVFFAVLPSLALGEDVAKEIESAKERVQRLESRAYEQQPALRVLEQMEKDAKQLYRTDEYKSAQRQTLVFIDSILNDKNRIQMYHDMRWAYQSISNYQLVSDLLRNDIVKPQLVVAWRSRLGERAGSMSDAEVETTMLDDRKKAAELGQEKLDKATADYDWPSYVIEYCRLWGKAETAQGGPQNLLAYLTPEELTNAREHLNRLQVQAQNLVERGK